MASRREAGRDDEVLVVAKLLPGDWKSVNERWKDRPEDSSSVSQTLQCRQKNDSIKKSLEARVTAIRKVIV